MSGGCGRECLVGVVGRVWWVWQGGSDVVVCGYYVSSIVHSFRMSLRMLRPSVDQCWEMLSLREEMTLTGLGFTS